MQTRPLMLLLHFWLLLLTANRNRSVFALQGPQSQPKARDCSIAKNSPLESVVHGESYADILHPPNDAKIGDSNTFSTTEYRVKSGTKVVDVPPTKRMDGAASPDHPASSIVGRSSIVKSKNELSSYESAVEVLRSYRAVYGNLVIPRRFVVPADDGFPGAWHGVLLACAVYNMKWWQEHVKQRPERVSELNELGFVWQRLQPEWNLVLEALVTFYNLHGHVLVPTQFVVPFGDDQWPKGTWGIALGNCVYRIRTRNDFLQGSRGLSRREQLVGLGFVWDVHEHRFRLFYRALRHYARLNEIGAFSGSGRTQPLRVPSSFRVPGASPDWPAEVWGYPLGARCAAVRQKELYIKDKPERRQMLDELGFHWGGNANVSWLQVSHAAAIYSKLHSRKLDVPYGFQVPRPPQDLLMDKDEWPWPEHLWGLPLGQRLKDVRSKGAYLHGSRGEKRRQQLEAMGFNWAPKKRGRPKASKNKQD